MFVSTTLSSYPPSLLIHMLKPAPQVVALRGASGRGWGHGMRLVPLQRDETGELSPTLSAM